MTALVLGGLPIRAQNFLQYETIYVGGRTRSQCGNLFGFSNGTLIEGVASIPCASHEYACDVINWLTAPGTSILWCDTDVSTTGIEPFAVGSLTNPYLDLPNSQLGVDQKSRRLLGGQSLRYSLPDCTEYTVSFWVFDNSVSTFYVVCGDASGVDYTLADGVPVASAPVTTTVDSFGTLSVTFNGVVFPGPVSIRCTKISQTTAEMLDYTAAPTLDALPYVYMSGDLFKKPIKVKVETQAATRRKNCDSNNLFDLQLFFAQVAPERL